MRNSSNRESPRALRYLAGFSGLLLVIVLGALVFLAVDPVDFRRSLFQPIREVRLFWTELSPLSHWGEIEKTVASPANRISLPKEQPDDLEIIADLRLPIGDDSAPAILLLHGSAPWGRKQGLVQLLGERLQEEGWIVLTPDARGFGDSEDPPDPSAPFAWTVRNDIERMIDFLSSNPRTDRKRIFVFGHSFGAGQALAGAFQLSEVKALILVGPPRFLDGSGGEVSAWKLSRMAADRELEAIAEEAARQVSIESDISRYADGLLREEGHKPLLLVDGEFESEAERRFLGDVAKRISPPVQYRTLAKTGHYCGVFNFFGSETIFYRKDLWRNFFRLINDYVDSLK